MNWSNLFEQQHSQPGATDEQLRAFKESVLLPLTVEEIAEINSRQRNPFPRTDPLHPAYRPFDPAIWVLPAGDLPETYLSLLRWANGGQFGNGERWFQFFPTIDPGQGVRAMLLAYQFPQYMPGVMPFALDGCGNFYLFDMRTKPVLGEYPILTAHAGSMSWSEGSWLRIADTFVEVCEGKVSLEVLRYGE